MTKIDKLLSQVPYTKHELERLPIPDLWSLAAALGAPRDENGKYGKKANTIDAILEAQRYKERILPYCELCGRFSIIREKAHIVAEAGDTRTNILMTCPTCHRLFDSQTKLRLAEALKEAGFKKVPESWTKPWGIGTKKKKER